MRKSLLAVIGLTLSAGAALAADTTRWPQYQGNVNHTGFVDTALHVTPELHVRWNVFREGFPVNGIAVGKDRVFTSTDVYFNPGAMIAQSVATGAESWRVDHVGVYSINPPALDDQDNAFYVTGNHGSDTYLRSYTKEGVFRFRSALTAQWEDYLAPSIDGNEIATNAGTYGGMYRYTLAGDLLSFTNLPQYDMWTPVKWGDRWLSYTNQLNVVNRTSGGIDFSVEIPNYDWVGYDVSQTPIIVNDVAYLTNGGRLLGFDLIMQTTVVNRAIQAYGQVSTDGERLYVIASGTLSIRDLAGNLIRNIDIATANFAAPIIVTRSHAIVRTTATASQTAIIDLGTNQVVSVLPIGGEMALAGDTLYVGDSTGILRAYDLPFILFTNDFE